MTEAVELLKFCASDLMVGVESRTVVPGPAALAAAGGPATGTAGSTVGAAIPTGQGVTGRDGTARVPGGTAGSGTGGSSGLFQELFGGITGGGGAAPAALFDAAERGLQGLFSSVGRALDAVGPSAGGIAGATGATSGQGFGNPGFGGPAAVGTLTVVSDGDGGTLTVPYSGYGYYSGNDLGAGLGNVSVTGPHTAVTTTYRVDEGRAKELRGVPVPLAAGGIVALGGTSTAGGTAGAGVLLVLPPECGTAPAALLPPRAAQELLHPDAVCTVLQLSDMMLYCSGSVQPHAVILCALC